MSDNTCLIRLTENALLVANTGQGFTRGGVVAICASHLGTKHAYTPSDPCPDKSDICVIKAIRDRELQTYKTNVDRIFSDFRGEDEIQHDYGGRALWELLQNADDAMAPPGTTPARLIGSKGVGFKSVLELSDEPQIHSGPFHFHFSAGKTQKLLREFVSLDQNLPPLTFRIPHDVEVTSEVNRLIESGHTTVICLPLQKEAHSKVRKWMEALDHRLLLLCQHLRTFEVAFPNGTSRCYEIDRGDLDALEDATFTIRIMESTADGVVTEQDRRYRRWAFTEETNADDEGKRHSVAICLQIDEDCLVPVEDTPPLHVFFPTREDLPFHALVHASFEVEQNRQHVRKNPSPQLLFSMKELLKRIVQEAPPPTILHAFVPEQEPNGELAQQIWQQFKNVLQESAFVPSIGGTLVKPREIRLWGHDLGQVLDPTFEEVKKAVLVIPELLSSYRESLKRLGATDLQSSEYPDLLWHCRNDNRESCLEVLKVLCRVLPKSTLPRQQVLTTSIDIFRKIPCWWTQNGRARALSEDKPLFKSQPKDSLPPWVQMDILDDRFKGEMVKLFSNHRAEEKSWTDLTNDYLLEAKDSNLLHKALIPALTRHPEEAWWTEHGGEALRLFERWTEEWEFDKISPVIWEKEERIDLAHSLRLPTNHGWLPAAQCYAGKAWGGPESFDIFFRGIADRSVLEASEQWPEELQPFDLEKWKGRLRYAGVSWEPKLLRFKSNEGLHFRDVLPNPWMKSSKDNKDEVGNWDYWNDYYRSLKKELPPGAKYLREQWALEFFPECLPKKALDRVHVLKPLATVIAGSFSKMDFALNKFIRQAKSLASYQIKNVSWLLCKPSLLHEDSHVSPLEAYMPGKGLGGLLPEVNVSLADNQEGRDLATFLTQILQVRENLPEPTDEQWMKWLNKLSELAASSNEEDAMKAAARELYKKVFAFDQKPPDIAQVKLLPCLAWSTAEGSPTEPNTQIGKHRLNFCDKDSIYWLDMPYLENRFVKESLLKKGVALFLLELKAGEKARDWLGLKPLSKAVKVKPQYQQESEDATSQIVECYRKRYQAIRVLAQQRKAKPPPAPENVLFKVVDRLSTHSPYAEPCTGVRVRKVAKAEWSAAK